MLAENCIFSLWTDGRTLTDTRGENGTHKLTPEAIDYEMQYYHSDTELRLLSLTQEGLEHFVSLYGASYKVLYLDYCSYIRDFSPLADLRNLEAVKIEWCRNIDKLWDMTDNSHLRVLSIHEAKKIVSNPMLLQTSRTLEEIRLWGNMDNKYTLESLACFQGMPSLKRIDLNQIKLKNHDLDVLSSLPQLEEFHFDAGMLSTEEIAGICAKYPNLHGSCLGVYTTNEFGCWNDIRICGYRKPSLDLPKDQKRLERYIAEFQSLVEKYRHELREKKRVID